MKITKLLSITISVRDDNPKCCNSDCDFLDTYTGDFPTSYNCSWFDYTELIDKYEFQPYRCEKCLTTFKT